MRLTDIKILELDKVLTTKRMYQSITVNKAIQSLKPGYQIPGMIGWPEMEDFISGGIDYERLSHRVTNLRISDGWMIGDVDVLDTPQGNILKTILNEIGCEFFLGSVAVFSKEQIRKCKRPILVEIIDFHCINAFPKDNRFDPIRFY